jgi:hypothetical protein
MALPVYSSRNVTISWGGVALGALSPDAFVTFSRSADITDEEVGSDGNLSISISPDRTGSCTLSFQQNSDSNRILSGVLLAQEANDTFITASLSIIDPSGSVIALLTGSYIKTAPEVILGLTAAGQSKDWVFFCEGMEFASVPEGVAADSDETARVLNAITTILGNV